MSPIHAARKALVVFPGTEASRTPKKRSPAGAGSKRSSEKPRLKPWLKAYCAEAARGVVTSASATQAAALSVEYFEFRMVGRGGTAAFAQAAKWRRRSAKATHSPKRSSTPRGAGGVEPGTEQPQLPLSTPSMNSGGTYCP